MNFWKEHVTLRIALMLPRGCVPPSAPHPLLRISFPLTKNSPSFVRAILRAHYNIIMIPYYLRFFKLSDKISWLKLPIFTPVEIFSPVFAKINISPRTIKYSPCFGQCLFCAFLSIASYIGKSRPPSSQFCAEYISPTLPTPLFRSNVCNITE